MMMENCEKRGLATTCLDEPERKKLVGVYLRRKYNVVTQDGHISQNTNIIIEHGLTQSLLGLLATLPRHANGEGSCIAIYIHSNPPSLPYPFFGHALRKILRYFL